MRLFTVASLQPWGPATSATISSAVSGLRRHRASITRLSAALIDIDYIRDRELITSVID